MMPENETRETMEGGEALDRSTGADNATTGVGSTEPAPEEGAPEPMDTPEGEASDDLMWERAHFKDGKCLATYVTKLACQKDSGHVGMHTNHSCAQDWLDDERAESGVTHDEGLAALRDATYIEVGPGGASQASKEPCTEATWWGDDGPFYCRLSKGHDGPHEIAHPTATGARQEAHETRWERLKAALELDLLDGYSSDPRFVEDIVLDKMAEIEEAIPVAATEDQNAEHLLHALSGGLGDTLRGALLEVIHSITLGEGGDEIASRFGVAGALAAIPVAATEAGGEGAREALHAKLERTLGFFDRFDSHIEHDFIEESQARAIVTDVLAALASQAPAQTTGDDEFEEWNDGGSRI